MQKKCPPLLLFSLLFFLNSCTSKYEFLKKITVPLPSNEQKEMSNYVKRLRSLENEKLSYVPDSNHLDHTPIKYVKINIHYMRKPGDTIRNFTTAQARAYVKEVYQAANSKLTRNRKMALPEGNTTPVLPMRYQYELTPDPTLPNDTDGIYIHDDAELYYLINRGESSNIFDDGVYEKYGRQKGQVINVFVMSFHADSLLKKKYFASNNGVGMTEWAKVVGWFKDARDSTLGPNNTPRGAGFTQKLFNHELGHSLGLNHTWNENDGCDDTPQNPNCWTTGAPPCEVGSNNFMDYNPIASAWSPCQIATLHRNMSNKDGFVRPFVKKTWCALDTSKNIVIADSVYWRSSKDLEGNIIIKRGGILHLDDNRVSLPLNGKISVEAGGKLILDGTTLENDCGELWQGIALQKQAKIVIRKKPTLLNMVNKVSVE